MLAIRNQKDFVAGLLFTVTGGAFAVGALDYELGTSARMGPGYFPLALGILLAILGALITLRSLGDTRDPTGALGRIAVKPLALIIGANVIFGVLLGGVPAIGLPPMGLIVSALALVVVASIAGDRFRPREVAVLAVVLAVASYLIFIRLLGLPFQAWPAFISG